VPLDVHDVGYRVVLRCYAGERGGRQVFSDVLGELIAWGDVVVVRTAEGIDVTVPRAEVAAAKRIPPRPERRHRPDAAADPGAHATVDILELERIAALGWRGLHTERLGGWLLRASGGWTGRANSVLPLGDPGLDRDPERNLDAALERVERWYAEAGLPPLVQVPLPARTDLRDALFARGWRDAWGALVMTASARDVLARLPIRTDLPDVGFADEPTDAWLSAYHYRGGALPAVAADVLRSGDQPLFAMVVEDGTVVAIARAALDEGWVGVTAVEVEPVARRRGLASHLLRAILRNALDRGAHSVYLQVDDGNTAARALYTGVGFQVHHTYRYLRAPDRPHH
jgi:ribosomal protein S18 acetylase RimI-like enzyme